MTAWWFLLVAGLGTAAFRVGPQLLAGRTDEGRAGAALGDAGTAALVAMTVGSGTSLVEGPLPLVGVVAALVTGAVVAHRTGHLLATVGSGLGAFWILGLVT